MRSASTGSNPANPSRTTRRAASQRLFGFVRTVLPNRLRCQSLPKHKHEGSSILDGRCRFPTGTTAVDKHNADKVFAGSIPELCDIYLVPLIYESYAIHRRRAARRFGHRRDGSQYKDDLLDG